MPKYKNGEYEVKCESDEYFVTLQDVAFLLSKTDYSSERTVFFVLISRTDSDEVVCFCSNKLIRLCLEIGTCDHTNVD